MKTIIITILLGFLVVFLATSCTGIKLENNCGKNIKQTVSVLPFLNDDYDCYKNVEKILEEMCYQIIDGRILLNEYSISTSKNFEDISFEEFCEFAKSRGVGLVIYGNAKIVWHEPSNLYSSDYNRDIVRDNGAEGRYARTIHDDFEMKQIIRGNYASVDCFGYDTQTKEQIAIFKGYKVKKINLGQPDFIRNNALK